MKYLTFLLFSLLIATDVFGSNSLGPLNFSFPSAQWTIEYNNNDNKPKYTIKNNEDSGVILYINKVDYNCINKNNTPPTSLKKSTNELLAQVRHIKS